MKIEHLALNVEDPISVARWYVENLGFTVKRQIPDPPWIHFLADDGGTVPRPKSQKGYEEREIDV